MTRCFGICALVTTLCLTGLAQAQEQEPAAPAPPPSDDPAGNEPAEEDPKPPAAPPAADEAPPTEAAPPADPQEPPADGQAPPAEGDSPPAGEAAPESEESAPPAEQPPGGDPNAEEPPAAAAAETEAAASASGTAQGEPLADEGVGQDSILSEGEDLQEKPGYYPGYRNWVAAGLSPHAPPMPPAAGGMTPSFGTPVSTSAPTFDLGATLRANAWLGIGKGIDDDYELHFPQRAVRQGPNTQNRGFNQHPWGGSGTLRLGYTLGRVRALADWEARITSASHRGQASPEPIVGVHRAFLVYSIDPLGDWQLDFSFGKIDSQWGGPGNFDGGLYSAFLGVRGIGYRGSAFYQITPEWDVTLFQGYVGLPKEGVVRHAHHYNALFTWDGTFTFGAHYVTSFGQNENSSTAKDGRFNGYALNTRWLGQQYGEAGLAVTQQALTDGGSMGWDGVHFTIGRGPGWGGVARFRTDILGVNATTGMARAIAGQYKVSLRRIITNTFDPDALDWTPEVGFLYYKTIESDDVPLTNSAETDLLYGYGYKLRNRIDINQLLLLGLNYEFQNFDARDSSNGAGDRSHWLEAELVFFSDNASPDRWQLRYLRQIQEIPSGDINPNAQPDEHRLELALSFDFL